MDIESLKGYLFVSLSTLKKKLIEREIIEVRLAPTTTGKFSSDSNLRQRC